MGVFFLALHRVLAGLYGLPASLLLAMGLANLSYAAYSLSLASRPRRSLVWIQILVLANAAWATVCLILFGMQAGSAGPLGLAHLAMEACFVGTLAALEWRWRHQLVRP